MIRFEPMTEAQFDTFRKQSIPEYAADSVRSGRWLEEEALEAARAEYDDLLPKGLATPDHYLCAVVDTAEDERVGYIWYAHDARRDRVRLYDIRIDEMYRGQGYGLEAMEHLEEEAEGLGAKRIRLHVFANNDAARALYERLGYKITNLMLSKHLANNETAGR